MTLDHEKLTVLRKIKADNLFPSLLTSSEKKKIKSERKRLKKSLAKKVSQKDSTQSADIPTNKEILSSGVDFDLKTLVKSSIDSKTGKMRELVDTRSLPEAKNFYDFCYRILGSDIHPPWAIQMWLASMALGEVCPRCTNPKYLDPFQIDKKLPSKDLNSKKRMTFLEHGVCPRCGVTRKELFDNNELPNYDQAVFILGQRCVTADTMLLTDNGIEYIGDLLGNKGLGYSEYSKPIHNGQEIETSSLCFVAKPEPLYKVHLEDGGVIECTGDHPLMTDKGWKKVSEISADDFIEVAVNTQCFGSIVPTWDEVIAYSYANAKGNCKNDKASFNRLSGRIGPDFFTFLGLWVSEGYATTVTQKDKKVNKFISSVLKYIFATGYVQKEGSHRVNGHYGYAFFRYFFGDINKGSYLQEVPKAVLVAPKEYVCKFLRGLYEGDGYIDKKGSITYYTVSEKLATELRVILYNLGFTPVIRTKITYSQDGTQALCYCVVLSRFDLERFANEIGFMSNKKQERVSYFLNKTYTNKVPFLAEKTTDYLISRFSQFVRDVCTELTILPKDVPIDFASASNTHHYKHMKSHIALYEFFGLASYGCFRGCKFIKHWRYGDYIDRFKILNSCQHIVDNYLSWLSYKLQGEVLALLELAKHYFVKVEFVKQTDPKPTYDLVMPKTHRFVGNSIVNHNSGKSTTAAIMAAYVLHRYLMYPVLSSMTDSMQASTELVFIFCSLTYQKAYDVLWTPFKNIINTAQWFKSYFQLLDQYKEQFGKELYVKGEASISFANKNIKCYPVGPTASRLRGNTAIMTVLDELGLFPLPRFDEVVDENDTNRRASADEAYTSLTNSLTTVEAARNELIRKGFNDAPPCLMLSVSSPVSKRDKVMRLYADSKTNPYIFAVRMATWQVNPHLEITSGPIASAFKTSERKALRDFGAQPAEGAAPYFPEEVVTQCFVGRPNSHTLQYQYDKTSHFVWGTVRSVNQYRRPTVMALDAGLVNNSFAIAVVGYNEKTHQTETVCVLEVIANDNNMVNFENLYRFVILPLCEQLNVCLVVADRWNSVDHLHRIRSDRGLRQGKPITYVKQYSLKVKDFEAVRTLMSNHTVVCPSLSNEWKTKILNGQIGDYKRELFGRPVEHFFMQLLTVNDLGPGLCPSKAEGLTDDIARAWILAVSTINKEKVVELIDHNRKFVQSAKSAYGRGVVAVGRSF